MRLNRRAALASLALVTLSAFGCGGAPDLPAPEVVKKASDALKTVNSLHFKLASAGGKMAIGSGLAASTIEGDVIRPDRLKGTAVSTFGKVTVEISFIAIGTQQFITNPLTKQWEKLPTPGSAANLLDPDHGAPLLLTQVGNLRKATNDTVAGVECYHVVGDLSASLVAGLVGASGVSGTLAGDVWVATTDLLPRRIHLTGPVTSDEPPQIQRVLDLSNFNESITIESPV